MQRRTPLIRFYFYISACIYECNEIVIMSVLGSIMQRRTPVIHFCIYIRPGIYQSSDDCPFFVIGSSKMKRGVPVVSWDVTECAAVQKQEDYFR